MPSARKPWLTVYRAPAGLVFWVENRKFSGSHRQNAKPRRPARVKASRFDVLLALGPRKSIGKRLNSAKVWFHDPKFRNFDGFHEISILRSVLGLAIAGILINTQVMVLNAWVTSLDVIFSQILTDFGHNCWLDRFQESLLTPR